MAEDERLREALLELQVLRDREARVLSETKTLLDCLEAYTAAKSPSDALSSIFSSLHQSIGSLQSMVLSKDLDGTVTVIASDARLTIGRSVTAPIDLFARARNISDIGLLGEWHGPIAPGAHGGLIAGVISTDLVLVTVRAAPDVFRRSDMDLVQRLAGLAGQALANQEIAAENTLLAATISGSSSGFAISDATHPDQPLIYVNRAFETLSGYSAEEALGENCRFLTDEAPDAPERKRLREAVHAKTAGTFLLKNKRKSGEPFWNELTLYPVHGPDGAVKNLVATQTDVTARVTASEDRDLSRARMERALTATGDAFLVLEPDLSVAFANSAVMTLFPARGADWLVGTTFTENWEAYLLGCEDLPGRVTSLLRTPDIRALAGQPLGREVDLPDGRSVLFRASALDDGGFVISATDITAMKSAQRLLAQRLAAIEAARDGIAVTDAGGRIVYMNSAAATLLGFSRATSGLGQKWKTRYMTAGLREHAGSFEAVLDRKAVETPQTHDITGSPLEGGGIVLVIRDVTDSLADEVREAEMMQELARLQRQEAIAQLTAGIAHDFNNLLSAINGSATLIGLDANLPPAVTPHLDRITAAGAQSANLISRLLDVGKSSETEGAFSLSSVLRALPDLLGTNIPAHIAFDADTDAGAIYLSGTSGMLSQILVNLVLNARDAIGDATGRIHLSVSKLTPLQPAKQTVGQLDAGKTYANLTIQDTGGGMPEEVAKEVFRPFFTTKGRQGSGLGLATAALQIQSVGGAISMETEDGVGTTFNVFWPVPSEATVSAPEGTSAEVDLSGMTVIVVDDDPNVSGVISAYLEAQGVEVAVCEDPRDVIDAVTEDPDAWSALITDYDMPIMNGGALARAVTEAAPRLPILVVTALAQRLSDPRLDDANVAAILAKPLDLKALAQTLAGAAQSG